ncbi:MAG: hypothetical protein MI864_09225 [Pseudomonadales bacterium]|nr:hypothetical protein [Pseudomonadales bacterium]
MEWSDVVKLPKYCPIKNTGLSAVEFCAPFYKVGKDMYVSLNDYNANYENTEGPYILAFLWSPTEEFAKKLISKKVIEHVGTIQRPPSALLPADGSFTYKKIKSYFKGQKTEIGVSENASYGYPDGDFVYKTIVAHPLSYNFQSRKIENNEVPFAIMYSLIGK